jgi:hypothetical protein
VNFSRIAQPRFQFVSQHHDFFDLPVCLCGLRPPRLTFNLIGGPEVGVILIAAHGRGLILGRYRDNAVSVDFERNFDLRDAARIGGMPTNSNLPSDRLPSANSRSP